MDLQDGLSVDLRQALAVHDVADNPCPDQSLKVSHVPRLRVTLTNRFWLVTSSSRRFVLMCIPMHSLYLPRPMPWQRLGSLSRSGRSNQ